MIKYPKRGDCADVGKRIQAGDELAFTAFFHELYEPVYKRALRVLKDACDAEEAAQDVFIKLYRKISKWDVSHGTFRGWFMTLAERSIIDAYRKKQREKKALSLDYKYRNSEDADDFQTLLESVLDPKPDALRLMVNDETMIHIETALLSVSRREYRLAWILRHLEGYSPPEVSRIMGCPVGRCKMWIHRCQLKMRRTLSEIYGE